MRQTSPQTTALIHKLYEPVTLRMKIMGLPDYVAILFELGETRESAAIPHVVPFLLSTKPKIAAAAATSVHKLILATPITDFPWLDEAMRTQAWATAHSGHPLYAWRNLTPEELESLQPPAGTVVSLMGLASFHHNGYVREAAIRKLSPVTTGAELPFLILRLNDWVINVRIAAYEATRARVRVEYCRRFIDHFALLTRLEHAERTDHKEIREAINRLLQSSECRAVLFESLQSSDRLIKRTSFKLALELESPDLDHVVKSALEDSDTVIRLRAAQRVASTFEGATLERFLDSMRRDRFMPVRREALRIAVKFNLPGMVEELRTGLLDSHDSMREECRYYLQKIQPIDFAAYYREHLSTAAERTLYAAISGLGETGKAADAGLIVPFTSHSMGQVRRAAIRTIAALDPRPHLEIFVKALEDPGARVSRQALKALSGQTSSLSAARIWKLFQSATHGHVKRHTFSLLAEFPKWESISYMLNALCDTNEKIVDVVRAGIQLWLLRFNRSFSTATPEQLGRMRESLEKCGHLIDEEARKQLWFLAKA